MSSVLFYAVVCCLGVSIKRRDAGRLDRLVRRAGSVVGTELDFLVSVAEDSVQPGQHTTPTPPNSDKTEEHVQQQAAVPELLHEQTLKNSFVPLAIRL